ncbi:MAG: hypothetical protein LBO08_01470 [Rickettsiales bacterium]|jgi:hypothetical protein|nr:hypothetical protein [Rickettsiales bacterium]
MIKIARFLAFALSVFYGVGAVADTTLSGSGTGSANISESGNVYLQDYTLNADSISAGINIESVSGKKFVVNPDFVNNPEMTATNAVIIADGIFMGNAGVGSESIHINSGAAGNIFTITGDTIEIDGFVNAALGTLVLNGLNGINIAGDILGNVNGYASDIIIGGGVDGDIDFNLTGGMELGGASLAPGSVGSFADWRDKFISGGGDDDLRGGGAIDAVGDIVIDNNIDGDFDIFTLGDLWVGGNLNNFFDINADNVYIIGDVNGDGVINADDDIYIGGNLGGNVDMNADDIYVGGDIVAGAKIRPNLPNGPGSDALGNFHMSPSGNPADPFKTLNLHIDGTYYFGNDSYLQLVLNQDVADADGNSAYNPDTDRALLEVRNFVSQVSVSPNFVDMNTTPNLEILVDGLGQQKKIWVIHADNAIAGLGDLDVAGVWFYDAARTERLFQEAALILENGDHDIMAILATMRRMKVLALNAAAHTGNDVAMASAMDDLIELRLRAYNGSSDIEDNLTNIMGSLFGKSDVYYKMMVAGGYHDDAVDVMVANIAGNETPASYARALKYIRGFGLDSSVGLIKNMAVVATQMRGAAVAQLFNEYTWNRWRDPRGLWLNFNSSGLGDDDYLSLNGGFDWQFNKKILAGINFGYAAGDVSEIFDFGLYGTYRVNSKIRAYASLNLLFNSGKLASENKLMGELKSDFGGTDVFVDAGIIHNIFSPYINGRASLVIGNRGALDLSNHISDGRNFMDIKSDGAFVFAPGYEIMVGRDVWLNVNSYIRPMAKFGLEYNLAAGDEHLRFKFSDAGKWYNWNYSSDPLWVKYSIGIDYAHYALRTTFNLSYEVIKNDNMKMNNIKFGGTARF